MFDREDIKELLEEVTPGAVLVIHYNGFTGHGINGTSSKSMKIREDIYNNVSYIQQYDGDINKTVIKFIELRTNYIIAKYDTYRKRKHSDSFVNNGSYGVVVPYDSINSIDIVNE